MQCDTKRRQQSRLSHIHVGWIKIRRDTLGANDPSPRPDRATQVPSFGKRKPHNFWLEKPVGVVAMEESAGYSEESI